MAAMSEEPSEEFRALSLSSHESQLEPSEEQIQLAKNILEIIDLEHKQNVEKLKLGVVTYISGYSKPGEEGESPIFAGARKATAFLISNQGFMLTTNHSLPEVSKELIYVAVTQEPFEREENHVQASIGSEGKYVGFARVVWQDPFLDIALMVLDKSAREKLTKSDGLPFLQLSDEPPEKWTYADVIGYPSYYQTSVYTRGVISCVNLPHATQGLLKFLSRTDAACNSGCSGSPVLFKLKVIGMHTDIANMDPEVNRQRLQFGGSLFLPVATIRKFLADNNAEICTSLDQLRSIGVI